MITQIRLPFQSGRAASFAAAHMLAPLEMPPTMPSSLASRRDHWNACYSILLFGGGLKEGYVHGVSDRSGSQPLEGPLTPGDILATLYRLLGVDPKMHIYDTLGRPHQLVPSGRVIQELIA